jgi:hypothetical protein
MVMGKMDLHELGREETKASLCRRSRENQSEEGVYSQSMSKKPPLQAAGRVVVVVRYGWSRECGGS